MTTSEESPPREPVGVAMWDDAWGYDLATGPFVDDLPYWEGLVEECRPRRILELACGTGRIAFPLAARAAALDPHARLVGLDASAPFLDRARARLAAIDPAAASHLRFVEGDMARFAFDETFDLIVLGFNSLAYLAERSQIEECLRSVRRHLAEGGRFAIDLATPNLALLAEAQQTPFPPVRHELEWRNPAPGVERFVSFYKTASYDHAAQLETTTHYWEFYLADGGRRSRVKDLVWRHFFPQELLLLLNQAGLTPTAQYGDYARSPFTGASPSYLWVMAGAG